MVDEKNVITIINWQKYQSEYERQKQYRKSKVTKRSYKEELQSEITAKVTRRREKREERREIQKRDIKNKIICPRNKNFSDEHLSLVNYFCSLILKNKPDYIFKGNSYREKWANELRLMVKQDKRNMNRIKEVMEFAISNRFWKKNILSVGKLRDKFDRLELEMEDGIKEEEDNLPTLTMEKDQNG